MKSKVFNYLLKKHNVRMPSFMIKEMKECLDDIKITDLIVWCKVYGKK